MYCKILANKLESDVYISLGCEVMECIASIYQEIRSLYILKIKAKSWLLSYYNVYFFKYVL